MKKYLISPTEEFKDLFIVNAINQDKAIEIFSDFFSLKDGLFLEHIYTKCVNDGFACKFWLKTKKENEHFMKNNAEVLTTDEQFKNRVRKYFGNEKEWAELYLNFYFSDNWGFNFETGLTDYKFPDEMVKFLWIKEINWYGLHIICIEDVLEVNPILDIKT